MKTFKEFINEANRPIKEEDIEWKVSEYFDEYAGEDAYDSYSDRFRSLKAAAKKKNDPLTDGCIIYIAEEMGVDAVEIDDKFREYIEDKLANLAKAEL